MPAVHPIASLIADAIATCAWTPTVLIVAISRHIGDLEFWPDAESDSDDDPFDPRPVEKVVRELQQRLPHRGRLTADQLALTVNALPTFQTASRTVWSQLQAPLDLRLFDRASPDVPKLAALDLPRFATLGDLAAWLAISAHQLDWYAGIKPLRPEGTLGTLVHYRYAWRDKPTGPPRLIEEPKPRLKAMQRRILHDILDHVPVHDAAHGFTRGRSVLTSAGPHVAEDLVIAADLADFFPSISAGRVFALFRGLGYRVEIARRLSGLTTAAVSADIFRELLFERRHDFKTRKLFTDSHLPQGAPTSPALANLVAYRLDVRLTGLARRFRLTYTRYADDLAFSGAALGIGAAATFLSALTNIAAAEGFRIRPDKTRLMRPGSQQRLLGMTLNAHLNIVRRDFDRLKAILHLAVRHGPQSQNRDGHANFRGHLDGRILWVEQVNPARGAKLRRLFERINWET